MDDIKLLDAVERYIRGEMTPDERLHFEQLRKTNGEVDQLVVEHTLFLQQMNRFSEWKKFKLDVHEAHTELAEQGEINSDKPYGRSKVVYLWRKYKRVTAIAASIAGITTIAFSALVWSVAPKAPTSELENLKRKISAQDHKISAQENKTNQLQTDLNHVKDKVNTPVTNPTTSPIEFKSGGTGFLIDAKGLMITNAHIVKNSRNIRVVNAKGQQFNAFVVRLDITRDVAVIKIDDEQFKPAISLPYSIRKSTSDIAEPVFTLGYPRDEVVYGEGYLSARTGFNGDTLSCQISIAANPGNSGGPIFDHNGEVIGILTSKETETEGVVFAVQSKYIYRVLDDLKKSPLYKNMKLPAKSTLSGLEKTQQVKKIRDFVFMVKGD
jgi:S1-C subfamily serine protease